MAARVEALCGGRPNHIWNRESCRLQHPGHNSSDNSNDFNPLWVGDTIYSSLGPEWTCDRFRLRHKSQQVKQIVKTTAWTSSPLRHLRCRHL